MAVRFLPPPEERVPAARDESENLAEVVQMRSWLRPAREEPPVEALESQAQESEEECWADAERVPERVPEVQLAAAEESADPDDSLRGPVYDDAVRLLARRARSSGELRSELLSLDHSAHEVSIIIDEFHESRYLDDLGLARAQCEKLRDAKGASSGQIRRKLRERKLPDSVIDEVVSELDEDEEYALLREAAQKRADKLTGLDRTTAQRRLVAFLARRGWSGEKAMRAANEAISGAGMQRSSGRASGNVRFE